MPTDDLCDWDRATTLSAAQALDWEPGTACGYHALTQGYLVGEVVRRITGRSLGTVLRDEIAEPLRADFHIGLPASEETRVAELVAPPAGPPEFAATDLQVRVASNSAPEVTHVNSRGSLAIIDLDARTTFCYVMNGMSGTVADLRGFGLGMVAWEAVGICDPLTYSSRQSVWSRARA